MRAAWLVTASLAYACGGEGFSYQGTPGVETALELSNRVPVAEVSLNGSDPLRFIVDTGAPLTLVDRDSLLSEAPGVYTANVSTFGLDVEDQTVVVLNLFSAPPQESYDGLLGGDLLSHFALTVDHQGSRGWLFDPFDPTVSDVTDTDARVDVPFVRRGGGTGQITGCNCTVHVPATRLLLLARFEDQGAPTWVALDTGASSTVVDESLFDELEQVTSGHPRLDGVTVTTVTGNVTAAYSRVYRLALVGLDPPGDPSVSDESSPVLVLPPTGLFDSISAEVGVNVRAIIGGNWWRRYLTTFDYQDDTLRLSRYVDQGHVPADEFVGVGFSLALSAGEWRAIDVYPGTDAIAQGLVRGEVIREIGGQSIFQQPSSFVNAQLAAYTLGQTVPVGVLRGQTVVTLQILVEDLLPEFLPP